MRTEQPRSSSARERELFLEALDIAQPDERAAFLDRECGTDHVLKARIQALLSEHEGIGRFLEAPAIAAVGDTAIVPAPAPEVSASAVVKEKPGDRSGRYKLLQMIGEGGAGVVYMADQEEPVRRRVAFKIIKLGMDTKNVIARFEAERQALAMMDHPNIAKVLDAGATETGRPYFVMELVRGIKITEYCDKNNLSTRERLALFLQVCQAIQHAHQKGVIHRDIKPSNILVTLHDGTPVPKVIDFGIAKATEHRLTEKTVFTEFTMFIGTPAYMSPEQAELSGLDIDTRSDIYSLGVLLYELLTGKTPFDPESLMHAGLDECRRTIREKEPAPPSTRLADLVEVELTTTARQRHTEARKLIHLVTGDLDWIAMKCLEKDRTRRYATAHDLALDIQRYLNGDPVLARPPSSVYRFNKFVRRHRAAFAAGAAIAVTLLAGATLSTWLAIRARHAEVRAQQAQHQEAQLRLQAEQDRARAEERGAAARLNEYVADINLAHQSLEDGNLTRAVDLLNKHQQRLGEPDLRGFEWRYLWNLCQGDEHVAFPKQDRPVESLAISPNGEWLAVGKSDQVRVYHTRTKALVATLQKGGNGLVFTPDSRTLLTSSRTTARAWRTSDWSELKSFPENAGPLALSRDGRRLATGSRDGVRIWDTATWEPLRLLTTAFGPLEFSPDGKLLATDSWTGITLWPMEEGGAVKVLQGSTNLSTYWPRNFNAMGFTPDGKSFVAARNMLTERGVFVLSFWEVSSGKEVRVLPESPEHIEHTGAITELAFSPDGHTLATASMDRSIRLWDLSSGRRVARLQGHLDEVADVVFAPDGISIYSAARDGSVKNWPSRHQQKEDVLAGAWSPLAFSRDSRKLAALNRQNAVVILDLQTREPAEQFQLQRPRGQRPMPPNPPVAISADFSTLAYGLMDGQVQVWNLSTGSSNIFQGGRAPVESAALSPDGHLLVTCDRRQECRWWDLPAGTNQVHATPGGKCFFSPDGKTLAIFRRGNTIELWDVAARALRITIPCQMPPWGAEAAFSWNGERLGIAVFDEVWLYDAGTGKQLSTFTGHKQRIGALTFSPDGMTLATTSDDNTLKFWNIATQKELISIRRMGGGLRGLQFSPDGQSLIGATGFTTQAPTGGIRFYHAPRVVLDDKADL